MSSGRGDMLTDVMLPARNRVRSAGLLPGAGVLCPPLALWKQHNPTLWLIASAAVTAALFAAALMLFQPFWESNDDIGMSMIAHGYGTAGAPSPGLLYQNVIIGEILQVLPTIDGVLPYSWLMMVFMFLSGWALLYYAVRSGGNIFYATLALALVLTCIVAAPQFSITAGAATAAAVLAWLSHTRVPSIASLVAGALLLILGYLVRPEEAIFVLLVSLPFVPWTNLPLRRAEIVTAVAVLSFLLLATLVDYQHYQGPEWAAFHTLDPLRVELTDYNFADFILRHQKEMHTFGFTVNDIQLISNWFFFDPAVADPARLQALLTSLPADNRLSANISLVGDSLRALVDPALAPLLVAAIAMTALSRCWIRATVSWAAFLVIIVAIGLVGRPAVLHIYLPIPILLLFACLQSGLRDPVTKPMWRVIPLTVLLVALVFALQIYIDENRRLIARSLLVREDVAKLDPGRRPIVWGAAFPYEVALPVLERDTRLGSFRHIALGWESLAPFSLDSVRELGWHDLTDRLARDKDIPLIAEKSQIALLSTYCHEHHHKNLTIRDRPLNTFTVHYVTCGDH